MATVKSGALRTSNVEQFINAVNGPLPDYDARTYLFIGRPVAWRDPADPTVSDDNPPVPTNNPEEYNATWSDIMSLKRVNDTTVFGMANRHDWASGTTYDMWNHRYSPNLAAASGATDIYDAKYVVMNSLFEVYVCLYNGSTETLTNGVPSTVMPINPTPNEPFFTPDGYQWIYLFTLTPTNREYLTPTRIPVSQSFTTATPVPGPINTVLIKFGGTNYTNNPAGIENALTEYYTKLGGDGTGAVAKMTVSGGKVTEVTMVRPGTNYTYATINFTANNVYANLTDLDNGQNALNPQGSGDFQASVIISPRGGWGADLLAQTGATSVGVFTDLDFGTSDFIDDVLFRQIGLLRDVEFTAGNENAATLTAYNSIAINDVVGTGFQYGETIYQTVSVDGVDKIAKGILIRYDGTNNIISYIQHPDHCADPNDGNLYSFSGTGTIQGQTSGTTTTRRDVSTTINSIVFTNGYADPEVEKFTGKMIYLSNISPVQRDSSQTEDISLIINY